MYQLVFNAVVQGVGSLRSPCGTASLAVCGDQNISPYMVILLITADPGGINTFDMNSYIKIPEFYSVPLRARSRIRIAMVINFQHLRQISAALQHVLMSS